MSTRGTLAGLVVLFLTSLPCEARESEDTVPLRLMLRNGNSLTHSFLNQSLEFTTYAGKIELLLTDLKSISSRDDGKLCTVETIHNDVWHAEMPEQRLRYRSMEQNESLDISMQAFKKIECLAPERSAWTPREHLELIFKDGSRIHLDPGNLMLPTRNALGSWDLPLGTLKVIKLLYSPEDEEISGVAKFLSGRISEFAVNSSRPYFNARDTFLNDLRIRFRDVRGLLCRIGIPDVAAPAGPKEEAEAAKRDLSHVVLSRSTSSERHLSLPFISWKIKGPIGQVVLPSPVLRGISYMEDDGVLVATTVYGEQFTGSLYPRSLKVPLPQGDEEYLSIKVADCQPIEFRGPDLVPPTGWHAWKLDGGDAFLAAFDRNEPLMLSKGDDGHEMEIFPDQVSRIERLPNNKFYVVLRENEVAISRPADRYVGLKLLVNGMRHRVSWKHVESIESNGALSRTRPRKETDRPVAPVTRKDTPRPPTPVTREERTRPVAPARSKQSLRDADRWDVKKTGAAPTDRRALTRDTVSFPGGVFRMGRTVGEGMDDEKPDFQVRVSPFYMDACEVTRDQFAEFVDHTGYRTLAEGTPWEPNWKNPGFVQKGDEPVTCVSWHDAARYCNWRSARAGLDACYKFAGQDDEVLCHRDTGGYRLPTEAEWEYAARQRGKDLLYPWGSETNVSVIVALANFKQDDPGLQDAWIWTNPVKQYPPNAAGLYGMAGNVWEWCQDWYFDRAYTLMRVRHPKDPCIESEHVSGLTHRAMRGGSFRNPLDMLRCASRGSGIPRAYSNRVGFRCVRSAITR